MTKVNLKAIVTILVLPVLVIAIQQVPPDFVYEVNAQVQNQTGNGTFALWRINAAIPNEKMEVSIADGDDNLYIYDVETPSEMKRHPYNPAIYYYDYSTYLPATLAENEMAIMCVKPAGGGEEYQCTEIFVTKNMARGIMYYYFDLDGIIDRLQEPSTSGYSYKPFVGA